MKKLYAFAALSVLSFIPSHADAAGFALNEESAAVMGTAFAGAAVSPEPAVQFTNPAGISGLHGNQIEVGGTMYRLDAPNFHNNGTSTLVSTPASGSGGGTGQTIEAPYLYYSHEINDKATVGFGIYSPYGLVTSYDPTWVGRYTAIESHINTTEFSPVLAYKVTPQLAIGGGPTVRYTEAKLTQAIDFGSIGAALHLNTLPQSSDGMGKVEGNGFGYGFKLGAKYQVDQDTVLGLGYRSRVDTRLNGQAHYSLTSLGQLISNASGAFTSTGAHTDLNTPQSVDVSVSHHLTDPLTLYGDVLWTGWSTFKDLEFTYDNPNQPTSVTTEKWRDTYRLSVGAGYDITEKWTLRTGYSYEQSPVHNTAYTTARIPDGDRHWVAFGAGYKVTDALKLDFAYDHLFVASGGSQNSVTNAGTLSGTWSGIGANIFMLNAVYSF